MTDKCPICGKTELTTYKSKPIGDTVRRLRRCQDRRGCGYKEIIIVRITEQVLARQPMAG
jgi:hypothetical protein